MRPGHAADGEENPESRRHGKQRDQGLAEGAREQLSVPPQEDSEEDGDDRSQEGMEQSIRDVEEVRVTVRRQVGAIHHQEQRQN